MLKLPAGAMNLSFTRWDLVTTLPVSSTNLTPKEAMTAVYTALRGDVTADNNRSSLAYSGTNKATKKQKKGGNQYRF
jgi:hypothetical protein